MTVSVGEATLQSAGRCLLELDITHYSQRERLVRHDTSISRYLVSQKLATTLTTSIEAYALTPTGAPNCDANTALATVHIMRKMICFLITTISMYLG